ncbi:MAG: TonB-dependent receptor [Bacteroidales bacterium]|nr:TonB-dependent receptor [Bacteroidales bacterium]
MIKAFQLISFVIFCFLNIQLQAQNESVSYTIEGTVRDSVSGEPLVGVSILCKELKTGVYSESNGTYAIKLPRGNYVIHYQLMGYKVISRHIALFASQKSDVTLVPESKQMEEVTVTAQNSRSKIESTQTGTFQLSSKELDKLPVLLGETDYFKAIQLMPGIQTSGEGNAAIYVRGGGYDQNLVLLDNATVYNPTHLLGFYSVFNSDIIGGVKVIKSGIPAEYGNRLSSVLEFTTRRKSPPNRPLKEMQVCCRRG